MRLLLLLCVIVPVLHVIGCARQPLVRSHGLFLMETNAGPAYGEAFQNVVDTLQYPNSNNGNAEPRQFECTTKTWSGSHVDPITRTITTFDDAAGVTYTVESTSYGKGMQLMLIQASDPAAARNLRDALARETLAVARRLK